MKSNKANLSNLTEIFLKYFNDKCSAKGLNITERSVNLGADQESFIIIDDYVYLQFTCLIPDSLLNSEWYYSLLPDPERFFLNIIQPDIDDSSSWDTIDYINENKDFKIGFIRLPVNRPYHTVTIEDTEGISLRGTAGTSFGSEVFSIIFDIGLFLAKEKNYENNTL